MITFQEILVPVDFSEPSKRAVAYGMTLAAQFHARLIIAHVVPDPRALAYAFPVETFDIEKEQYEKAKRAIQALVPAKYKEKIDVRMVIKTGSINDELLGIIKDEAADLIVMGTHGRRHLGRWFLGSTTERMLRKAPVPVLTVSHVDPAVLAVERGFVSLKRILYATDLSPSASAGMKYAFEMARRASAKLTIVYVVDHTQFTLLSASASGYLNAELARTVEKKRAELGEAVARDKPPDVEVETLVLDGRPYEKILEASSNLSADMIVLNTRSKEILERAFLGSTAERVVRLANVPVFLIPVAMQKTESRSVPA